MLRDTLSFSLLRLSAIDLSFDSVLKGILLNTLKILHWKIWTPDPDLAQILLLFLADELRHKRVHISSYSLSICKTLFWQDFTFYCKKIKLWVKFFENNNNFLTEESCTVRLWYLQNREDFWEKFKATLPRRNSNLRREMERAPSVNKSLTTLDVFLPDFWSVTFSGLLKPFERLQAVRSSCGPHFGLEM